MWYHQQKRFTIVYLRQRWCRQASRIRSPTKPMGALEFCSALHRSVMWTTFLGLVRLIQDRSVSKCVGTRILCHFPRLVGSRVRRRNFSRLHWRELSSFDLRRLLRIAADVMHNCTTSFYVMFECTIAFSVYRSTSSF